MLFRLQKLSVYLIPAFIFFFPGTVTLAQPGWVITERISGPGIGDNQESILYIRDNRIKSVEGDHHFIFDLDRWQLTLLAPSMKGFWRGTPAQFMEQSAAIAIEYIRAEILLANENDKAYLEALYEDLKMEINRGNAGVSFIGELPVEIVMTGERDFMLGYPVNQYIVYVDGYRVEELWLTPGIKLGDQYEFEKFRAFSDEMSWGQIFQNYRSSQQYIHLLKQGIPLKTLELGQEGVISITEATAVEYTDIPEIIFGIPSGYKPVDLAGSGFKLF
jgi:hypothetical protein